MQFGVLNFMKINIKKAYKVLGRSVEFSAFHADFFFPQISDYHYHNLITDNDEDAYTDATCLIPMQKHIRTTTPGA